MTDDMEKTAIGVLDTGEETQMLQPAAEATQYAANVTCPVCQTPNPPSETYCIDCGFVLSSEPVAVDELPETPSVGSLVTSDGAREFALKPGENTVGRQDADILLAHNTVSREHAKITVEGGKVFIEDLGSTNGTTVGGKKLESGDRVELTDGAEVVFGSQALRLKAGSVPGEATDQHGCTPMEEGETEATAEPDEGTGSREQGIEETSDVAEDSLPQPPVARLMSADGALSFDLHDGAMSVGRRDGNDIVIPDPYCSGSHAEIKVEAGTFAVTDVGSTNGSMVNGVRLEPNAPREVRPGDEITLGRIVFKIEAPE